jgi:hypothetical protein
MLCCAMLCYAMLCYAILCHVTACRLLLDYVLHVAASLCIAMLC